MSNSCDNKSVGVIVKKHDNYAVIKRKNYPISLAFVAGHLDGDKPTYAAKKEVLEEAGIQAQELSKKLDMRFSNPCKREGGSWHEWHVFEATRWSGEIKAGSDAQEAFWASPDELHVLADRTRYFSNKYKIPMNNLTSFTAFVVESAEWKNNPGLEPVWVLILEEIGVL